MLLHSIIQGTGTPLLILHGYFGMADNWKSQANNFSKNYEVHLIDQRNHGRSFHTDEFSYELMVADLKNYIDHYQLNNVALIGHSMGGKTAMLFAVTYPELVEKLIVVDISPKYYAPHHNDVLKALNAVDFSKITLRSEVEGIFKKHLHDEGVRQFLLKNIYRITKDHMAFRFNLNSLTQNNPNIGESLPSFSTYDGPTLFLRGALSNYVLDQDVPLINAHFGNTKLTTINNAGHWLHAENPIDFYQNVIEFLANPI